MKILSKRKKKIIKWGSGLGILVTSEAKELMWSDKTKVSIEAVEDEKGKVMIIREAE